MPKRYTFVKKLRLLTFGSVNYASTAGGYAAVSERVNSCNWFYRCWRCMLYATGFTASKSDWLLSGMASDH